MNDSDNGISSLGILGLIGASMGGAVVFFLLIVMFMPIAGISLVGAWFGWQPEDAAQAGGLAFMCPPGAVIIWWLSKYPREWVVQWSAAAGLSMDDSNRRLARGAKIFYSCAGMCALGVVAGVAGLRELAQNPPDVSEYGTLAFFSNATGVVLFSALAIRCIADGRRLRAASRM